VDIGYTIGTLRIGGEFFLPPYGYFTEGGGTPMYCNLFAVNHTEYIGNLRINTILHL
jgi:hypothetical protein